MNIRILTEEDYEIIMEWWKQWKWPVLPRHMLPDNGKSGYMVEKDGKLIVCGFLYLTNSKFGYCDYMISDMSYKGRDRFDIVLKLMNMSIGTAWELGCEDFWFVTKSKGMLRRCKALGVKVSEDPYYLICSSNSKKEI